jgi:hypothetical protein
MAFKSVEEFNDNRYKNLFRLINDEEYADVIFLYRSMKEMLVANVHYIKSAEYNGYVHCCEQGCPACNKGIRVQTKLFIPVYNVAKNSIEFFDRSMKFEPQLERDVFNRFPNPSEFVFRITRHGQPNDINTTYSIEALGHNKVGTYNEILAKFNATFPDYYSNIVKDISAFELANMLQSNGSASSGMPDYTPTPRAGYVSTIPDTYVSTANITNSAPVEPEVNLESISTPESSPDISSTSEDINTSDNVDDLPDPIF